MVRLTLHLSFTVPISYKENLSDIVLETIRIVKEAKGYHILVIIADGQVTNAKSTSAAIVAASFYPMYNFVTSLTTRKRFNFQF